MIHPQTNRQIIDFPFMLMEIQANMGHLAVIQLNVGYFNHLHTCCPPVITLQRFRAANKLSLSWAPSLTESVSEMVLLILEMIVCH